MFQIIFIFQAKMYIFVMDEIRRLHVKKKKKRNLKPILREVRTERVKRESD